MLLLLFVAFHTLFLSNIHKDGISHRQELFQTWSQNTMFCYLAIRNIWSFGVAIDLAKGGLVHDFMTCIQSVQVTSWRIASPMKQLFGSWRIRVWKALKGLLLAMLWGSHSDFAEKPWDPKFECCRLSPAHDFHLQSWKKLTKTQTIPLSQGLTFRIFSLLGLCFCVWLLELVFVACPSSPCWQSHDISCIAQDKELIVLYGDMVPWLRTQAKKKHGKWWLLVQLDARHSQNGPLVSWLVVLHSRGYRGL